jgi:hypothetical protein
MGVLRFSPLMSCLRWLVALVVVLALANAPVEARSGAEAPAGMEHGDVTGLDAALSSDKPVLSPPPAPAGFFSSPSHGGAVAAGRLAPEEIFRPPISFFASSAIH